MRHRPAGARSRSAPAPICMLRPGRRRALREHPRPLDPRPLPRAQPHLLVRGGRRGDRVYIGSADLMPRNLDRRIEVLVPVENARARQELRRVLDSVFADDDARLEARKRRRLDAVRAGEAREARRPPSCDDAPRPSARPTPDGRPLAQVSPATVSGVAATIVRMRVAVIDVGSNTARLLVAAIERRRLRGRSSRRSAAISGSAPRSSGPAPSARGRSRCARTFVART